MTGPEAASRLAAVDPDVVEKVGHQVLAFAGEVELRGVILNAAIPDHDLWDAQAKERYVKRVERLRHAMSLTTEMVQFAGPAITRYAQALRGVRVQAEAAVAAWREVHDFRLRVESSPYGGTAVTAQLAMRWHLHLMYRRAEALTQQAVSARNTAVEALVDELTRSGTVLFELTALLRDSGMYIRDDG